MRPSAATAARSLAFGAIDDGVWGVAWLPSAEASGPVLLGAGGSAAVVDVSVEGQDRDAAWRVVGAGADLMLSPTGAVSAQPAEGGLERFDQLCRVEGRVASGGTEHRVRCLGWRAGAEPAAGRDRLASFRQVAAWFEPGDGLALLALRPRSARGQEGDRLAAAVFDLQTSVEVSDPRLSTTYDGAGLPRRAGLELWIGDEEEQHPRRAAGEAIGEPAAWSVDGLDLRAALFRWHSRGQDGTGVYLMGTLS